MIANLKRDTHTFVKSGATAVFASRTKPHDDERISLNTPNNAGTSCTGNDYFGEHLSAYDTDVPTTVDGPSCANYATGRKCNDISDKEKKNWFKETFLDSKRKLKKEVHEKLRSFPWLCGAYGLTGPTKKIRRPHIYLTVKRGVQNLLVLRELKDEFKCNPNDFFELFEESARKPNLKFMVNPSNQGPLVHPFPGGGVLACSDPKNDNPLRLPDVIDEGNLQPNADGAGTLTMFCTKDGRHYALTCCHVGFANDENRLNASFNKAEDIKRIRRSLPHYENHARNQQYYFVDQDNNYIRLGDFDSYHFDDECDILSLKVSKTTKIACQIEDVDRPDWDEISDELYERVFEESDQDRVDVEKVGFSSGLTKGYIVPFDLSYKDEDILFQDAFVVKSHGSPFLEGGDSGSLVFFDNKNNTKKVFAYGVCEMDTLPLKEQEELTSTNLHENGVTLRKEEPRPAAEMVSANDDQDDFDVIFSEDGQISPSDKTHTKERNLAKKRTPTGPYYICLRLDTALEKLKFVKEACFNDCGSQNVDSNGNMAERILTENMEKIDLFQRNPKEYLDAFESIHKEMRTDEETFIIDHLLKRNASNSPVLNGNLEQLALLACCSSPHVVKRALDALLNEIFLSISDFSRIRCHNILQAENIIRESFQEFLEEHLKGQCQRITTYAWLITFVLLKGSKEGCNQIAIREIKAFDKTLDNLLRKITERSTFRYGIHLAREAIKRIVQQSERKNAKESLQCSIERCANILHITLDENEVRKLGKALNDEGDWLNLHVCLVFLQDLPKFHQFHGNLKPIILIQMLIQNYRDRCSTSRLKRALRMANSERWRFEILVYHVMLRLIRTSSNQAITEQVLLGKQGCGGVFSTWSESISRTIRNSLAMKNLEKICKIAAFQAPPDCFEQLITCIGNDNAQNFIEDLAILRLSSQYKDKVLEILPKLEVRGGRQRVSTYDALMSGKKCVLKLYRHSKEEILKATDTPKTDPLRKEIEIVKVLNALAEPCPNLVQLLGSNIEAPMHMIIERGSKGDLLAFLHKNLNFTETKSLTQIALDICSAMLFIHSQKIIHRDLRAKNCFVFMQDGKHVAKIGDFHLATIANTTVPRVATYYQQRNNSTASMTVGNIYSQFPVPWMAVETLQFGEFSTASDVWSYGVLLFEIFTLGSQPYVNMPSGRSLNSDEDVRKYVTNGNRLELHPRIPESIQVIIQSTMVDADHRPTFSDLKDSLLGMKFADNTYVDSSYFQISHDNENPSADIIDWPISASTGCTANGCVGECLNASDVAVPIIIDGNNFIKQFVPASTRDILKLSKLECPSLAIITSKIFHDEKLELLTEVGDMGSLKLFINEYECSMENAIRYLSQIGEAVMFLHNRRFIHRNLRTDSVFIYSSGNAKLACFARVRELKLNADDQSSTIPINLPTPDDSLRWSSPEVITDGEYSKASDMWAFAVMIWEMFSLIDKHLDKSDEEVIPYRQLSCKEQILSYLQKEKRLGKPNSCPDWLYEMMLRCWEDNTQDRAKAQDIVNCINEHTSKCSSQYQAVVDPLH